MRPDLEQKILEQFPLVFRSVDPTKRDAFISCGDGWRDLLISFLRKLMALPNVATPIFIHAAFVEQGDGGDGPGLAFAARFGPTEQKEYGLRRRKVTIADLPPEMLDSLPQSARTGYAADIGLTGWACMQRRDFNDLARWARVESQRICETCGKRGAIRVDRIFTSKRQRCPEKESFHITCDEHAVIEDRKLELVPPKPIRLPEPEPEPEPQPERDGTWVYHDKDDGDEAASWGLRTVAWICVSRRRLNTGEVTIEKLASIPLESWWCVIQEVCQDPKWKYDQEHGKLSSSGIEIMEELKALVASYGFSLVSADP